MIKIAHTIRRMSKESESSGDIVSRIETIKKLFDEGILTEEEYQKKKDELVSQI